MPLDRDLCRLYGTAVKRGDQLLYISADIQDTSVNVDGGIRFYDTDDQLDGGSNCIASVTSGNHSKRRLDLRGVTLRNGYLLAELYGAFVAGDRVRAYAIIKKRGKDELIVEVRSKLCSTSAIINATKMQFPRAETLLKSIVVTVPLIGASGYLSVYDTDDAMLGEQACIASFGFAGLGYCLCLGNSVTPTNVDNLRCPGRILCR